VHYSLRVLDSLMASQTDSGVDIQSLADRLRSNASLLRLVALATHCDETAPHLLFHARSRAFFACRLMFHMANGDATGQLLAVLGNVHRQEYSSAFASHLHCATLRKARPLAVGPGHSTRSAVCVELSDGDISDINFSRSAILLLESLRILLDRGAGGSAVTLRLLGLDHNSHVSLGSFCTVFFSHLSFQSRPIGSSLLRFLCRT
jgi:hypothetical protein